MNNDELLSVSLTPAERHLLLERFRLPRKLRAQLERSGNKSAAVLMSAETADELREAAQDLLLTDGFDADYRPTPTGTLLEDLIDKFFTG